MLRVTLTALIFSRAALSFADAQTQTFDVAGVRLGQTLSETKAKFKNLKVVDIGQKNPAVTSTIAYSQNEAWVLVAVSDKIAYIQHQLLFPDPATRPKFSDMEQRATTKYGKLGEQFFDSTGKPYPAQLRNPCDAIITPELGAPLIAAEQLVSGVPPNSALSNMYAPLAFRNNCGVAVNVAVAANTYGHEQEQLATRFEVTLLDQRPLFIEAARWAKLQQAQKQAEQDKSDKTRLKPPM